MGWSIYIIFIKRYQESKISRDDGQKVSGHTGLPKDPFSWLWVMAAWVAYFTLIG